MTAAATRFFSLFERNATTTATGSNLYPFRAIRFPIKLLSYPTLRFRCYSSSSASLIDDETQTTTTAGLGETTRDSQQHPWPEWVNFVDRLKAKGYLQKEGGNDVAVYKDMSILKEACLSFGRDRFDLFKSLSMQDVQTLVEKGCPNINRKTVNSGKRLRAHLQLDEGDVCGVCILRGSCDRAYVLLKDIESAARTVDVVRILLNCALDPVVDLNKKPSGAEVVEASARKLLSELTELSESTIDPDLQKPPATVSRKAQSFEYKERDASWNVEMQRGDWMCPKCNFLNFSRNKRCRECNEDGPVKTSRDDIEMKKGDWMCPKCNFVNFSRNKKCRECNEDVPINTGGDDVEMKKGDWICPQCNFMNFSRNIRCLKCKTEGPKRVGNDEIEMKKGDWNCPQCRFMNFASNTKCLRCREQRPKRQLNPGEWECPSCDFYNFGGNICRKCKYEQPNGAEAKYEDQIWRKPS